MNIQTVATNLRNTIAGKVKHQVELEYALTLSTMAEGTALTATLEYLKINIGELKRILQDVESCVAKDVEQSWRENPDRSGGQFTQEEIDNANRW
jgi:hypothetical protein